MAGERAIAVDLDADTRMVFVAEQLGPALVAADDVVAKLGQVTSSIEKVSGAVLDSIKRVAPTAATVELGFSLAIESGHLVAMFGKGKGEASITVTLEWRKSDHDPSAAKTGDSSAAKSQASAIATSGA